MRKLEHRDVKYLAKVTLLALAEFKLNLAEVCAPNCYDMLPFQ